MIEHRHSFPTIFPVACHTNNIGVGSTFVAIKGMKQDGILFIPEALKRGARTIVVQDDQTIPETIIEQINSAQAQLVYVDNTRQTLAQLSAQALNFPAKKLKIIGITGTKGKSTTTYLVEHVLRSAGYKTALLSTVKNRILETELDTQLTTQQPDYLHVFFNECVNVGVEWVVMEVAAQAFSLHRVDGIEFDLALFTNFSQEHAEFYSTLEDYFSAKKNIINYVKTGAPLIVNNDDIWTAKLCSAYEFCKTFSLYKQADYSATIVQDSLDGLEIKVQHDQQVTKLFASALSGTFNAYNMLAAYSITKQIGLTERQIADAMRLFSGVPGRMNRYTISNGARFFIDYAHNPASYEAVLSTLKKYTPHLIAVFGAGGERDRTKRPIMGAVARQYADVLIITSDNPRSEDPATIAADILLGIPETQRTNVYLELDREKAIRLAYALSNGDSIAVMLGKGPDEYQLIQGIKYPFSERQIVCSL